MSLIQVNATGFVLGEVKGMETRTGKTMVTFATAHSKSRKNEDTGEWERVSQMIVNWVAFDAEAEHILASVEPKTEVHVCGEIYEDTWTSPDGDVKKSVKGVVKACSGSIARQERSGGSQGSVW